MSNEQSKPVEKMDGGEYIKMKEELLKKYSRSYFIIIKYRSGPCHEDQESISEISIIYCSIPSQPR